MPQVSQFGGSINDYLGKVRSAFNSIYYDAWIQDVFETYIIVSTNEYDDAKRQMYKVSMTPQGDGTLIFGARDTWEKVKLDYVQEMVQGAQFVAELGGSELPDIETRSNIDWDKLTKGDPDPYFITLQIGETDSVSQNNLLYDDKLVRMIVEQINNKPIQGIMGHLKQSEKSTSYKVSDVHWLGATQVGNKAFAKGYIPFTAQAQREHFKILEATGDKASTSIYGWADAEVVDAKTGVWRANDFILEQLDLAPFTRAALQPTTGHRITSEMLVIEKENEVMPTEETTVVVETVQVSEFNKVVEELNLIKRKNFMRMIGDEVKETIALEPTTDTGKEAVSALRIMIAESAASICDSEESLKVYLSHISETIKPVLAALVQSLSGPKATTVTEQKNERVALNPSEDERNAALAEMGLGRAR